MRICLTILFTFIFCILVLLPVFFSIKKRWSENKKTEKIETESPIEKRSLFLLDERSLQSQPMFWTVIALPLVVGAILWAFIAYQYEWEISTSAYSSLMKNAQFPFLIIALSPILGAFVMYGHRSIQTFTQINATNTQINTALTQLETAKNQLETAGNQLNEVKRKNQVDIYYAKRKHILDLFSLVKSINDEKISMPVSLYWKVFYKKNEYEDELSESYYSDIDEFFKKISISWGNINDYLKKELILNFDRERKFKLLNELDSLFFILNEDVNELKKYLFITSTDNIKPFDYTLQLSDLINGPATELERRILYDEISTEMQKIVKDFVNLVYDISLIFLPYDVINNMFTNSNKIYSLEEDIRKYIKDNKTEITCLELNLIGDKLAAENQNPPE